MRVIRKASAKNESRETIIISLCYLLPVAFDEDHNIVNNAIAFFKIFTFFGGKDIVGRVKEQLPVVEWVVMVGII